MKNSDQSQNSVPDSTIPTDANGYYSRGLMHRQAGNFLQSCKDLQKALALEPNNLTFQEELRNLKDHLCSSEAQSLNEVLPGNLLLDLQNEDTTVKIKAVESLRKWSPVILSENNVLSTLAIEVRGASCPALQKALWGAIKYCVSDNSALFDIDNKTAKSRLARDIDKPILVSEECKKIREKLKSLLPAENILTEMKNMTRQPLADSGLSSSVDRASAATHLVSSLPSLFPLDDANFLSCIDLGLSSVGSEQLALASLNAFGAAADFRRRQGSRVMGLSTSNSLLKCLASSLSLAEDNKNLSSVTATISSVLLLLSDKDRNAKDLVDMDSLVDQLVSPYLDKADKSAHLDWQLGIIALNCVLLCDKDAGRAFVLKKQLLPFLMACVGDTHNDYPDLPLYAAQTILTCCNFPEFRKDIIEMGGTASLMKLMLKSGEAISGVLSACLSRLSSHDPEIRKEVFEELGFCDSTLDLLNKTSPETASMTLMGSLLETILFLSMHEVFKKRLLESPRSLSALIKLVVFVSKTMPDGQYMACGLVYNLLRYEGDQEPRQKSAKPGDIDLDDSQIKELEEVYKKLPKEARPVENGMIEMGCEEVAEKLKVKLLEGNVVEAISRILTEHPSPSVQLTRTGCRVIRKFVSTPALRGAAAAQGGLKALLHAPEVFASSPDDLRYLRQAVAQLCISVNPKLLSYREGLDSVPQLVSLLEDYYELYQYEAGLAITNLASCNEDLRVRCWHGKAWQGLFQLLFSDNDMLKAAALEGFCNMSVSPLVGESFAQNLRGNELQIFLAFATDASNTRIQHAAAGAVATLCYHDGVPMKVLETPNLKSFIECLESSTDAALIVRGQACLKVLLDESNLETDMRARMRAIVDKCNVGDKGCRVVDGLSSCV